jgi:hypothetical protein
MPVPNCVIMPITEFKNVFEPFACEILPFWFNTPEFVSDNKELLPPVCEMLLSNWTH